MAKKLWGSRFPKGTNALTDKFTSSIAYDKRLACYDVLGSIAHARMLGKQKIISAHDAAQIIKGLQSILKSLEAGEFKFDMGAEDVHSNIQEALSKRIGKVAQRLHTARSRNDQVALDIRMYLKDELNNITALVTALQKAVLKFARNNAAVIIPGYTHLQAAQYVLLAHHMLAYIEALERDKERIADAYKRTDAMPLGSCALSGTGLPIDRDFVRKELGFKKLTDNSMDSVSDRDFIIEALGAFAILSVHLSRMAEDLILWSTKEFGFIDIDFSFCTGSSIMPHKKNPDVLELIRGSSGRIQGDLTSILVLMKGLPYSYNRDLQLDKPPLFDSADTIQQILMVFAALYGKLIVRDHFLSSRQSDEALFSVDVLEYLVRKGVSSREAHDIVGRIVRDCLDKGYAIFSLGVTDLQKYSSSFSGDVKSILNAASSVGRKSSYGGTAPRLVNAQLKRWESKLRS